MVFKELDSFSETFSISDDLHAGFIDLFKDKNPLHTDADFAKSHNFDGKVMHGNILNGFLSYFIGECLPTKDVIIHSQDIQFKNPFYINDVLTLTATVNGIYESVNAVEFKYNFKNSSAKTIAKGKIQIGIFR